MGAHKPYPYLCGVERPFSDKTLDPRNAFFKTYLLKKKTRLKSNDEGIEEKKSIDNKIVKITNVKEITNVINLKNTIKIIL